MRRLGSALVALLVAVLVAGCGGSNPKPSPVSEAPSKSASPSGAPTMPAEARGTTAASAEAFVRYYLAEFSYAGATGDLSTFRKLGDTGCESCNGVIQRIESTYASGGHATAGYHGSRFRTSVSSDIATVSLVITGDAQTIYASAAASPSVVPGSRTKARFHLRNDSGTWAVRDWTRT